ncbi:MAG: peptidoglycan editing factor PgeF [Cyanobacteria bacterium P01_F01_bin.143]
MNDSSWQWQEWDGLPYLTCDLLSSWRHGFFTQQCYPNTPEKLVTALDPKADVYRVKQVHGNQVLTPEEIKSKIAQGNLEQKFPDADGMISDNETQALWVASADCNPVLIGDVKTGKVAAIHAGWRGTSQKIVPEAIALFQADGSNLEDLRIAMGAAITGEVYQVTETVAAEVGKTISNQIEKEKVLHTLFEMKDSPLLEDEQAGRVKLDVRRVNAIQLEQLGISPEQIAIAPYCTYQQPEYWFSYRRTKEKKVQWSGIIT